MNTRTCITLGLLLAVLLTGAVTVFAVDAQGLRASMGPEGLTSLVYQGSEFLVKRPAQFSATFVTPDGKEQKAGDGADAVKTVNGGVITRTYPAMTIVTALALEKDILHMTVTFRNTGANSCTQVTFQPFTLQFPRRPDGGRWKWGYQNATTNTGMPGIVEAASSAWKVLACVDDIERPITFGFDGNYGNSTLNPVLIQTMKSEPLKPGEERTYHFSLRFAPGGADTFALARDLYDKFAKVYPYKLKWTDRRPIGELMLCNSATHFATNPRGWFNDPKLDVTTEEGRKDFHDRLMKSADTCIGIMKEVNAQGMIFWDLEGEEMPHAITYLGDPRILPKAAPEMDACADEFFQKFRAAGLKVGVCIRPSRIIANDNGGWAHLQTDDAVAEMSDKIAYAKKRWGCTIFYMDTNVRWEKGMWSGDSQLLPASDLYELTRRHPDVLIFPEFGTFGYWSCTMPYGELRGGNTGTSDLLRAVYPSAGSTITIADGDYFGNYDALLAQAVHGDIQLYRTWFGDSVNLYVKYLYREAGYLRAAAARQTQRSMTLELALQQADPQVRYTALLEVKPGDKKAAALLVQAVATERDWVVQRKMITLLGASADQAAVPVLATFVRDNALNQDYFAAAALGQLGPLATSTLAPLAADKDPRIVARALQALSAYTDEKALPAILPLVDNSNAQVHLQAIRALGAYHTDAVVEKLIAQLQSDDPNTLLAACAALGRVKDRRALTPLVETIERAAGKLRNNTVRAAAGDALEAITDKQFGPYEQNWRRVLDSGQL